MSVSKIKYCLQLADNALILGHRLSEWCGHGPVLEQDIALTNIALDHIGQARSFFQYAAEMVNRLPDPERKQLFTSAIFEQKTSPFTEDDLAYLRDAWDFKNVLLTEQPNGDWAQTVARSFFYDQYNSLLYTALSGQDVDATLKAIAEKSLKETRYHTRWSSEWVIRLGDGTVESHRRMQNAIDDLWPYTEELLSPSEVEISFLEQLPSFDPAQLKNNWHTAVYAIIDEATLQQPDPKAWMQRGGKDGIHSEHLGFLLAEMQYIQRAYPGMEW